MLATISCKTGEILFRRILESSPRGELKFLHFNQNTKNVAAQSSSSNSFDLLTVSGTNPALIRGWDVSNGNLAWEWSMTPLQQDKAEHSMWFYNDYSLFHVLPVWNSHIELTEYHASTGQPMKSTTKKISFSWIAEDKCVLSKSYFACLVNGQLLITDLLSESTSVKTIAVSRPEEEPQEASLEVLKGREGFIQIGTKVINLNDNTIYHESNSDSSSFYIDTNLVKLSLNENTLSISAIDVSGNILSDLSTVNDLPDTLQNDPRVVSMKCKSKSDNQVACRILLSTADGALFIVQQGKIFLLYYREKFLNSISF